MKYALKKLLFKNADYTKGYLIDIFIYNIPKSQVR
jgi:hypothetical protein